MSRNVALVEMRLLRVDQHLTDSNGGGCHHVLREVLPSLEGMGNSEVDSVASAPERDDVAKTKEDDTDRVRPFRSLWPVTERADQDDEQETQVELEEHFEDRRTSTFGKEVERIVLLV